MKKYVPLAILMALVASCARPILRVLPVPPGCSALEPLPLTVDVDASAAGYRSDINHAMKSWDKAIGRPAFVWNRVDETPADVLIAAGPLYGNVRGVGPSFCHDGHVSTVIVLATGLDVVAATAFSAHELGHALGLGHSEVRESVMFPTVDASLMGDWDSQAVQRILPTDARVAAALHAGGPSALAPPDAGPSTGLGTSPSAAAPNPVDAWAAFGAGHYALGVALLLILALSVLRRLAPSLFSSDAAGTATAFAASFLGALATSLGTGGPAGWGMVTAAFTVGVLAVGGYSVAWRKCLKPALHWLAAESGWGWLTGVLK